MTHCLINPSNPEIEMTIDYQQKMYGLNSGKTFGRTRIISNNQNDHNSSVIQNMGYTLFTQTENPK